MPTKASFTVASCRKHVQLLAYAPSCRCIDTGGGGSCTVTATWQRPGPDQLFQIKPGPEATGGDLVCYTIRI